MLKKKVMSIAISPELQEELDKVVKRKNTTRSFYLHNLISQAIKINVEEDPLVIGKPVDDSIIPVVLKIPLSLKSNSDKLKAWLDVQTNGILKAVTNSGE